MGRCRCYQHDQALPADEASSGEKASMTRQGRGVRGLVQRFAASSRAPLLFGLAVDHTPRERVARKTRVTPPPNELNASRAAPKRPRRVSLAHRHNRFGLCRLGVGGLLFGFRPSRHLRRSRREKDRGPASRHHADLRAGPEGARRPQRARGAAHLLDGSRQRRSRTSRRSSSPSGRPRATVTGTRTSPMSMPPRPMSPVAAKPDRSSSSPNRRCRSAPATRSSASAAKSSARSSRSMSSPTPSFCAKARRSRISSDPTVSSSAVESERAREDDHERRSTGRCTLNKSAARLRRPAHVGADQIRRQRLSGGQDHLHQRDRGPVREDGRQRPGRRPRYRSRQAHRRRNSSMPVRATAARAFPRTRWRSSRPDRITRRRCASSRPLSLSTTSASARWGVKHHRSLRRQRCGAKRSPSSGSRSNPTPTTCARRPRSRWSTALQDAGATLCAATIPRAWNRRGRCCPASTFADNAYACIEGARTPSRSSPNGTSSARSTSPA